MHPPANCLEVEATSALAVGQPSRVPSCARRTLASFRIELQQSTSLGKHMIFHSPEECGTGALLESRLCVRE